jgi:hypothetical protein
MKRKVVIGSILAAVLIILTSLSSVLGTTTDKSDNEKTGVVSPLFALRTQRFTNNVDEKKINSNYLGKGKILNLGFQTKTMFNVLLNRAFKKIENNPETLNDLLTKLENSPKIFNLLKLHDIDINKFKNDIAMIKSNPALLKEKYEEVEQILGENIEFSLNDPIQPLGLFDQWQPGALLVALIMLPVLLIVTIVIATILILTCIIPNCFAGMFEAIVEGFLQGLHPPKPLYI